MPASSEPTIATVGAGGERLGEIAGIFDAAIGDHRRVGLLRRLDAVHDRGELRHADAGDDARGADRARADADLDGVGAGVDQRLGAFAVATLPATTCTLFDILLDAVDGVEHHLRMAVRGVDHDEIDAGVDQRLGARIALVADRGRRGDAQPPLLVLAGVRIGDRLLDVLHGDQADAAILIVDHQQLLDAVLVQQPLGLVLADAFADGDQAILGHQLGDLLLRIGGEAHVAVGQDADQLAGLSSTTGMPEMRLSAISLSASASVASGWMVSGLTTMPVSNFLTCRTCAACSLRLEIAMDDADAAGLRHGDRHLRSR